ncbi:diguanylate cyclase domain-containing protein [Anaplasma phagocytophilum]|uniref:diguanylate cyclase domain-containing protein n=1 Tax=Anaplasma phagocytophilum TaxID=948 RepID=UPI0007E02BB2|nr:diguanylate cyclase [Anaplasma phagocytophilum]SBO30753.1 hypothetical protein ANAPC3_00297 [Anaplasma phagocytophilum]SBO31264.1 hypothetical protein ANAPC2_00579 [Anaplasma phagocytophilum]SBO33505.1 hypothetical protein ANAPC4_01182 [Anaplasma phagocytophilum]SCV64927.1 hypothetical protein ANAPC5_01001 [Anaplasma phagocytophilum]
MNDNVIARRANDAVISLQQNNVLRKVIISAINDQALRLLGFDSGTLLIGAPLDSILDLNTKHIINSYVEYTNSGTDLADVISKISNFALLNCKLQAVPVRPKIFRVTSEKDLLNYELLVRDTSISQKLAAFRSETLPAGTRYTMDKDLEILDPASTKTEIDVILGFVRESSTEAVISLVALDPTVNNAGDAQKKMHSVIVGALSANIRYTDIVGYLGNNQFMFVLLGCSKADAHVAVSRIHARVSERLSNYSPGTTISFGYSNIGDTEYNSLLANLQQALLLAHRQGKSVAASTN